MALYLRAIESILVSPRPCRSNRAQPPNTNVAEGPCNVLEGKKEKERMVNQCTPVVHTLTNPARVYLYCERLITAMTTGSATTPGRPPGFCRRGILQRAQRVRVVQESRRGSRRLG